MHSNAQNVFIGVFYEHHVSFINLLQSVCCIMLELAVLEFHLMLWREHKLRHKKRNETSAFRKEASAPGLTCHERLPGQQWRMLRFCFVSSSRSVPFSIFLSSARSTNALIARAFAFSLWRDVIWCVVMCFVSVFTISGEVKFPFSHYFFPTACVLCILLFTGYSYVSKNHWCPSYTLEKFWFPPPPPPVL